MTNATYRAGIIGLGFIGGADQVSGDASFSRSAVSTARTSTPCLTIPASIWSLAAAAMLDDENASHNAQGQKPTPTGRKCWLESLDIVSVATYAPVHAEITVACAKQFIRAIYCEKPIATQLPDAEQMVKACDDTGALLVLNHQRRFNLNQRRLRELIAADGLGRIDLRVLDSGDLVGWETLARI